MARSMVYKLHFWPPYKHAGHYSGKSDRLPERLTDHTLGRGARLTQVQRDAGGTWVIGLIEPGGSERERQIKGHDASRHCDVCQAVKGLRAGEFTSEQALARAGWDRATECQRGVLLEILGIDPAEVNGVPERDPGPEPVRLAPEPEPFTLSEADQYLVDDLIDGWQPREADREAEAEL